MRGHQLCRRSKIDGREEDLHAECMIIKLLIGYLIFDGVLAVLFLLLIVYDSKAADRKLEEAFNARDNIVDDYPIE